ncbi:MULTISPECIES: hypothetical protein [Chryseobacterium]|jgi:sRNA-binding protein|uniref:hypothetical protein n=1 Tax=Chryseobacterium TaxID=59732 RepID=UPI000B516D5D|nr:MULTISPECIES: hypothetical protein [Chryseobacterium]ASE62951.1 hypothetical protein CEQ15_16360 [Chryseobacterium indologenes]MDR3023901.1 hypothetical protein [Chryseobacterium sp.]VFA42491.1 Uncharacterised protein [Chryseobacterium indologenes]
MKKLNLGGLKLAGQKKLSRKELKNLIGASGGAGRYWRCCKEYASPEQCGSCGNTACDGGYYAKYC